MIFNLLIILVPISSFQLKVAHLMLSTKDCISMKLLRVYQNNEFVLKVAQKQLLNLVKVTYLLLMNQVLFSLAVIATATHLVRM